VKTGVCGYLCQGQVRASLQEFLDALHPAQDDLCVSGAVNLAAVLTHQREGH